jgi:hypothetical protein
MGNFPAPNPWEYVLQKAVLGLECVLAQQLELPNVQRHDILKPSHLVLVAQGVSPAGT